MSMNAAHILRYLILLTLIGLLFKFVYLSVKKLLDEKTKVSNYEQNDGSELPSVTICLKWLNKSVTNTAKNPVLRDHALPNVSDWSFEDYLANSYSVKDIINEAMYVDQPDDKFM